MQPIRHAPSRTVEFGIYRDGDNNLDELQAQTIAQARAVSHTDSRIEFAVEDTTARAGAQPAHVRRTERYVLADGKESQLQIDRPHDMSSRAELAHFVARTLDAAQLSGAKATWIDLVDHGAGDGGGLEADTFGGIMRSDDIAGAIADGDALYAREHPEDRARTVDGVVANQCLMSTVGFEDALSHAGVHYLAASPETMLAPGVPSTVASDIAQHLDDSKTMARSVVERTMEQRYGPAGSRYTPAAAFDVLDISTTRMERVENAIRDLNGTLVAAARDRETRTVIRQDARTNEGMARFPHNSGMPWRADRPAVTLYNTFATDGRLPDAVRQTAREARDAVKATVLAHDESGDYAPFHDADYSDATGPNVHFPIAPNQIDPWAPKISETDNDFYKSVGGERLARALA